MKLTGAFDRQNKRRLIALGIFALMATALVVSANISSTLGQQGRSRQIQRRRPVLTKPAKVTRDYSLFKHEDHRKELNGRELACSKCHTIPSAAQPDRVAAATRPDSTLGYPFHDSCWRCHRQEVFHGDRPVICTVCHTRVSPRITSRDVHSQFPSPKHRDITARELPGYFPHGLHQNLMVWDRDRRWRDAGPGFSVLLRASFKATRLENAPMQGLNCAACHLKDERGPIALPANGVRSDESLKRIEADTFMTTPGEREANAHASCFNCHWQVQKPTKDDCEACHLSRAAYTTEKLATYRPVALLPNALRWFEDWPTGMPKRLTLKFQHNTHSLSDDGKSESNEHGEKCTTCHINITRVTPLKNSKLDVQIISCARCHAAKRSLPGAQSVKLSISDEIRLKQDRSKDYICVACHMAPVGREQPPCTHYFVIGEPCPKSGQADNK